MRPPESFVGQPIRSLQTMLRVLQADQGQTTPLIPDGIYGPETVRSVSAFQRSHGIPVTGIADPVTWDAIVKAYEPALLNQTPLFPVTVVLEPGTVISPGDTHALIPILQGILLILSHVYQSIGHPGSGGVLDEATQDSLSSFQALAGLPMTGLPDRMTWKHLALHYPLAAGLHRRFHRQMP